MADMKLAIGDNDLLKVTQASELAGIGVRFPMLDLSLVELTGALPADFKVRGFEKRHIFKRAFRSLLPPEILIENGAPQLIRERQSYDDLLKGQR